MRRVYGARAPRRNEGRGGTTTDDQAALGAVAARVRPAGRRVAGLCLLCGSLGDIPTDQPLLVRRGDVGLVIVTSSRTPRASPRGPCTPSRRSRGSPPKRPQRSTALRRGRGSTRRSVQAGRLQPRLEPRSRGRGRHRRPRPSPRRPLVGDTNFMPVLADVKVLPEHLLATRDRLQPGPELCSALDASARSSSASRAAYCGLRALLLQRARLRPG
jgi:hypothetical protein